MSAKVEKLYVAAVSFALGVAGTALGFFLGVVPYFRVNDVNKYDWFFATCVGIGALAGFIIGVVNGARWYNATEASPLIQKRMLSYLHRRCVDARGVPQRTFTGSTLRSLLGSRRLPRA